MDKKATKILEHYKKIIEECTFDEYDVLGLLIFIRNYLKKGIFRCIYEFADLIAHRDRDNGLVNDCIVSAIESGYELVEGSNEVKNYHGINYETWLNEWKRFGEEFEINIDNKIIKELTVCIFSLAQFTNYNDKRERGKGRMELFVGKDGKLALVTEGVDKDSLGICFLIVGGFEVCREICGGYLSNPVEAIRVDGKLRLIDEFGLII